MKNRGFTHKLVDSFLVKFFTYLVQCSIFTSIFEFFDVSRIVSDKYEKLFSRMEMVDSSMSCVKIDRRSLRGFE